VEAGGRKGVTLARKELKKAGGRERDIFLITLLGIVLLCLGNVPSITR
jgi:hypothetical protein